MLEVDFHSHTLFSLCGIHTVIELLERAKKLGMQGLAITDHGPAQKGRINSIFYERLHNPVEGIRLLKGMECNIISEQGEIDLPMKFLPLMDIVLLGIHPNTPKGLGIDANTELLVKTIERNPHIDVITHPNDPEYPLHFEAVAKAAKKQKIALEINNSKVLLKRTTVELTTKLVKTCKDLACPIALCSDAHTINELGLDDSIRPILKSAAFPDELIVNNTAEKAFSFINTRKARKLDS